jgi:hypothetical protein
LQILIPTKAGLYINQDIARAEIEIVGFERVCISERRSRGYTKFGTVHR